MKGLKLIFNLLFNIEKICGKQLIEEQMVENYGNNWLSLILEGLESPKVRASLKETLKLN